MQIEDIMIKIKSLDNCEVESYHAGEGEFLPPYLAATRNDDSRNASSSLFLEECG